MEITIQSGIQGAMNAIGYTVIVDVFRAFSLEAYLLQQGATKIYIVEQEETARKLKQENPSYILIGERQGKKMDGFAYGNSPSSIAKIDFHNRTIIHTTTNGTKGILNAKKASHIYTGALVNAKATMEEILSHHPQHISIVGMGWNNHPTEEDELCAQYMKSICIGKPMTDIEKRADDLRYGEGRKFFQEDTQEIFPKGDFAMCTKVNCFDFYMEVKQENGYYICQKGMKTNG